MNFGYTPPPHLDRLAPEKLTALDDGVLESAVQDYVLREIRDGEAESEALERLPWPLNAWYLGFVLEIEVLNGGFNQYFFNSSRHLASRTPVALEAMDLLAAADLVRRAIQASHDQLSRLDHAAAAGTAEAFAETYIGQPFVDLDEEYYQHEEEWRNGRISYLRRVAPFLRHP